MKCRKMLAVLLVCTCFGNLVGTCMQFITHGTSFFRPQLVF